MPRKIEANTYLLFIDPAGGTDWSNIVCLTSFNISATMETVDAGTACGPASFPGDVSANIPFSGFTLLDPVTGEISAPDLYTLMKDKTSFSWKIGPAVPVAGDMTKTGLGYFSAYNENYDEGQFGAFGGTITVSGDVVQAVITSTLEIAFAGNTASNRWAVTLKGTGNVGDVVNVDYSISLVPAGPHVPFTASATWATDLTTLINDLLTAALVNDPNVTLYTDGGGFNGIRITGADFATGTPSIIYI